MLNIIQKTTGAVIMAICLGSRADALTVPLGSQGKADLITPKRGASMSSVVDLVGQPMRIDRAVGDPPIATWHYPEFRVYFEYDKVIHSVKNPAPMSEH